MIRTGSGTQACVALARCRIKNRDGTNRAKLDLGFGDDEINMLISVYTRRGGMQEASTAFVTLGPRGNTHLTYIYIPFDTL